MRADEDVERAVERGGFVVHGSVELQEEVQRFTSVQALELLGGGHVHGIEPRGASAELAGETGGRARTRSLLDEADVPFEVASLGLVVVGHRVGVVLLLGVGRLRDNLLHRRVLAHLRRHVLLGVESGGGGGVGGHRARGRRARGRTRRRAEERVYHSLRRDAIARASLEVEPRAAPPPAPRASPRHIGKPGGGASVGARAVSC